MTSAPADAAVGVSTSTPISVTLTEAAELSGAGSDPATLSVLGRNVAIDVKQTGATLQLTPKEPLHRGAAGTAAVQTLSDKLGNMSQSGVIGRTSA